MKRSPRRPTRLRAVLAWGGAHATGPVRDMSATGLFVDATVPLAVGQRIALVPLIGDRDTAKVPGEVVRIAEGRGVAVRFLGVSPGQLVPSDAPELLLTDDDTPAAQPGDSEHRRSSRHDRKLVVLLHELHRTRRLHATDIAHHGLFVVADEAPQERELVRLSLLLPDRTLEAIGVVTRVIAPGSARTEPGFGLAWVALSDADRVVWSAFVDAVDAGPETVLLHPESPEQLYALLLAYAEAGGAQLPVGQARAPGDDLQVVVVHPLGQARLRIPAVVVSADEGTPGRVRVHFLEPRTTLRDRAQEFLRAQPAPALAPALQAPPPVAEAAALAQENARLRERVAELEATLTEAERAERSLFDRLHDVEARARRT